MVPSRNTISILKLEDIKDTERWGSGVNNPQVPFFIGRKSGDIGEFQTGADSDSRGSKENYGERMF